MPASAHPAAGVSALAALLALAVPAAAFWRLPCDSTLTYQRIDPIINPDAVSGHEHIVFGGNAFNATMTYADTQAATCSSCRVKGDMSNYWVPSLWYVSQNGTYSPVPKSDGALVYYLQRTDPDDPKADEGLQAFPEGFGMVAGAAKRTTYNASSLEDTAVRFNCLGGGGPTPEIPDHPCPNGLRAEINFPSCWNGELDSDDHKSHVAYPSRMDSGRCPDSHPHRFITLFYETMWSTQPFMDDGLWWDGPNGDGHPFVLSNGDTLGYSYHGDFYMGWDRDLLQTAIDTCTNDSGRVEDCPAFEFYDGDETGSCRVPLMVSDPVVRGSTGKLPGCVSAAVATAAATNSTTPPSNGTTCADAGTLTAAQYPFTDATAEGYAYVGCANDAMGGRLLSAASSAGDDMTVDKCIAACKEGGYKYAGLEWARECFCGDDVPADRMPSAANWGGCDTPCAGDAAQVCGGTGKLALYEACGAGDCHNLPQ
jgi:hypothetical protein